MSKLKDVIDELVTANRILANEGIVDSFGHVSVRHPKDAKLICCRAHARRSWSRPMTSSLYAKLQMQALTMGRVKFLSKGEVDAVIARTGPYTLDRAWEAFARRAGRRIKEPR